MKRRDFLKSTGVAGAGLLTGLGAAAQTPESAVHGAQPNILFFLVDELRYPTAFPDGIKNAGEFLAKFMPNLHKLWKRGVKFENYHTAANACTPSRGVIITGLYSQQNWLITTILSSPDPNPIVVKVQPVLNPAYPTYGKLLRQLGYDTPYRGKWHVSIPLESNGGIENYGFDYDTYPDPTGSNLQGTYGDEANGYHSDAYTADKAASYLSSRKPDSPPWCLTVGFVNPHDREFFPAGTEFQTVTDLFNSSANPGGLQQFTDYSVKGPRVPWDDDALKSPKSYGYPAVPPNWESNQDLIDNKPTSHAFIKQFSAAAWGGITDDPSKNTPADRTVVQYPNPPSGENLNIGVAQMEYTYWQRGLDSYTQIMEALDVEIGTVLDALEGLPQSVVENTVIVFASDHGEYSGAHGIVQGKMATLYEEAWRIPLIVVDPSHRFTGDIDHIRTGLASSVDLSTLLISLGNMGTRDWMQGNLRRMYGSRHNMIGMLKSAKAPGRKYILHATDEIAPGFYNFNSAPTHVVGVRTETTKFGIYSEWLPATSTMNPATVQLEFYDYSTRGGRMETANTAKTDPRVEPMYLDMIHNIIPNELQQFLPLPYRLNQVESKVAHLIYRALIDNLPLSIIQGGGILGFGHDF